MKIGFLFPGQGSQVIGMGKDIYDKYEEARNIYRKIEEITKIEISKISFYGPEETLNETKYTQLAILTMSLSILELLKKENIEADISAGLSLGEYTALIYSKKISFEDGIYIIKQRGRYMQELAPQGDWLMAAILGLDDKKVEELCTKVTSGFVVPANYNCKGQVAVSGEKKAVEEIAIIAKEMGAKKVIPLKTAGPFHTEKLKETSKALEKDLKNIEFKDFTSKVVKNIDGTIYQKTDNIKEILVDHITHPVKFSNSIETMIENGIDTFIEIGPGRALSGFVKKTNTDKEIRTYCINNVQSLEETINDIKMKLKGDQL